MSHRPSIVLAEDHILVAEGIRRLLEPDYELISVVHNGKALIEAAREHQPDLVLTDISMPGMDGLEAAEKLREVAPQTRVIILSVHDERDFVHAAFEAGARGYLLKSSAPQELPIALEAVLAGRHYVTPEVTGFLLGAGGKIGSPPARGSDIRVLVADDHATMRDGMRLVLEASGGIEIVGEAANGVEAVALAEELCPDVVLMDLLMPEMDGVEAIRQIHARQAQLPIIILTALEIDERVLAGVRAGARGYLSKHDGLVGHVEAIRRACQGETIFPRELTRKLAAPKQESLTPREREVLTLLARGLSNKEIAGALFVSEVTIRTHVHHLQEKLKLSNRVELALYALQQGWVDLPELGTST